jgi:hypothetical protein
MHPLFFLFLFPWLCLRYRRTPSIGWVPFSFLSREKLPGPRQLPTNDAQQRKQYSRMTNPPSISSPFINRPLPSRKLGWFSPQHSFQVCTWPLPTFSTLLFCGKHQITDNNNNKHLNKSSTFRNKSNFPASNLQHHQTTTKNLFQNHLFITTTRCAHSTFQCTITRINIYT